MPSYSDDELTWVVYEIWIVYFCTIMFNSVMLLNFIISVIGQSFEEVMAKSHTIIYGQCFDKVQEQFVFESGCGKRLQKGSTWVLFTLESLERQSQSGEDWEGVTKTIRNLLGKISLDIKRGQAETKKDARIMVREELKYFHV